MKPVNILVALESDRYVLARPEEDGVTRVREIPRTGPDDDDANRTLAQAIRELDGNGCNICLGLPGEMVLAAAIDLAGLPRRRRRTAMLYRLEEHLPLDIEAVTAVFLPPGEGQSLALAVQTDRIRGLVEGLQRAGVGVDAICPTALLVLEEARRGDLPPADHVIIPGSGGTDILRLAGGSPIAWYTAPPGATEWLRCLEADLLAHPPQAPKPPLVLGPIPDDVPPSQAAEMALKSATNEPAITLAARGAAAVLSGKRRPWADFRQGALAADGSWLAAGRLAKATAASALLLLATLAAALYVEAVRYGQLADTYNARQVAEYRRLLPSGPVPPSIPSRLRSEISRLAALSGASGETPERPNALDTLRRIAVGLPPQVRLKITQLQIRSDGLSIEGEAPAHTDAEVLAQGLGRAGFLVDAPRTENRPAGGVSFTVTGRPAAAAPTGPPSGAPVALAPAAGGEP